MILWYINRQSQSPLPLECGGNFFLANYGIRVQNAVDTSIVCNLNRHMGHLY